jgi:hypothetical protein
MSDTAEQSGERSAEQGEELSAEQDRNLSEEQRAERRWAARRGAERALWRPCFVVPERHL